MNALSEVITKSAFSSVSYQEWLISSASRCSSPAAAPSGRGDSFRESPPWWPSPAETHGCFFHILGYQVLTHQTLVETVKSRAHSTFLRALTPAEWRSSPMYSRPNFRYREETLSEWAGYSLLCVEGTHTHARIHTLHGHIPIFILKNSSQWKKSDYQ